MDPITIITFIQALLAAGTEATMAWQAVSKVVNEGRNPTADEWRIANADADAAHAAVQAAHPSTT